MLKIGCLEDPFDNGIVKVRCTPEDIVCFASVDRDVKIGCDKCEAPVYNGYSSTLFQQKPEIPFAALSNDMMILHAPEELYQHEATVMTCLCKRLHHIHELFYIREAVSREPCVG